MGGGDRDEVSDGESKGVEGKDGEVVPVGLSVYFPSICKNHVSNLKLESEVFPISTGVSVEA
jgi:hypothetical protein